MATATIQGREEYLSSRPVAQLIFQALQDLDAEDIRPIAIELLEEAYGPEMTQGQRSSGYAILAEMVERGFIEYRWASGRFGVYVASLESE